MSKINKLEECVFNDTSPLVTMSNELDNNEMYYNCSECPSMIEILSLEEDNNFIEFKCLNTDNEHKKKRKIKMLLKDYLESMKTHNNKVINAAIAISRTIKTEKIILKESFPYSSILSE